MNNPQGNTVSEVRASTAHTPGPWVAIHDPGYKSDDIVDNGGYRIDAPHDDVTQLAYVWVLNHRHPGDGKPQQDGPLFGDVRAGANARLIAAAPDMLALLKTIDGEFSRLQCTEDEAAIFAELDAVIAKATGTTDTHRDKVNEQRAGVVP